MNNNLRIRIRVCLIIIPVSAKMLVVYGLVKEIISNIIMKRHLTILNLSREMKHALAILWLQLFGNG